MTPAERVALITGANRGLGREVGEQLLRLGYTVVFAVRRRESVDELRDFLEGTAGEVLHLDVTDEKTVTAAVDAIATRHGRLDALVNNAAVGYDLENDGVRVDLRFVRSVFETNLFGAWRVIQLALPLLRRSAHPRIVNVSSEGGSLASMGGGTPSYSTSKAALNALTRVIAAELSTSGILVNAVCPGWTATDMGGPGGRPVADGARSIVWGVTLPDNGPTGGFFRDGHSLPW